MMGTPAAVEAAVKAEVGAALGGVCGADWAAKAGVGETEEVEPVGRVAAER